MQHAHPQCSVTRENTVAVFRLNSVKSVLLVVIPGQGDDIEPCNTTDIAVRTISDDAHLCQPHDNLSFPSNQ